MAKSDNNMNREEELKNENQVDETDKKEEENTAQNTETDMENDDEEVNDEHESAEDESEDSEEELSETEKLSQKVDELNDKYLRLFSEFDNFRKRTIKEKSDIYKTAGNDIIKDLLPVMDDFERALKSADESEDTSAHKEGMLLVYNKLKNVLKQKGVEEIDAMEKEFDTDLHEAITKIKAPKKKLKGKVVDVVEKGYKLNDKVIRYSKVVIGE